MSKAGLFYGVDILLEWLRICVMAWPLAWYMTSLARTYKRSFPLMVPGWLDTAFLCGAMMGLVTAGPLTLILKPLLSPGREGSVLGIAWLLYMGLSGLVIVRSKRGLVLYNCSPDSFKKKFSERMKELEPDLVEWKEHYIFPKWEISFRMECSNWLRNVSLIPDSSFQNASGWSQLEAQLHPGSFYEPGRFQGRGQAMIFAVIGLGVFLIPIAWLAVHVEVAQELYQNLIWQFHEWFGE